MKKNTNIELLERDLYLKQLQINRLLDITQAINENLPAKDLFKIYNSTLSWELGIKKMILFIRQEDEWAAVTFIEDENEPLIKEFSDVVFRYERLTNVTENEHPLIGQFDIVIPVQHKNQSLAFALLGGFEENDDVYNKVMFIKTFTNIITVAIENKRLFNRQLEQERLKKEMELASNVQKMLVPEVLPQTDKVAMSKIYMPHQEVGGDYFDYIQFDESKFVTCIADISGKGMAAALLMANFQAIFRTLVQQNLPAEELIEGLNKLVFQITKGEKFITFFFANFDHETNELVYINAGHNPPLLAMNNEVHELSVGTTIIGAFEELPFVDKGMIVIEGEAMLVSFTDGLTDLINDEDDFFSEEKLLDFTRENHQVSPAIFNDRLLALINKFKGNQKFPDDIAVLTTKIFNK